MFYLQKNTILFIVLALAFTFIFSVLINSILLKFSQNLGTRNAPDYKHERWSINAKPSLGGISFFVIFLISVIVLGFIDKLTSIPANNLKLVGVLVVCTIAFIMGLADDAYNTKPLLKFIIQIGCGLILYFTGTQINIFSIETLNLSLTVLWVAGIMNSINMLDNMDGITTVVAIIIICFVISLSQKLNILFTPLPILCLGVLGALLGFLTFNWHPSKMFMGDAGSQFLGCFLAVLGIDYCWNAFSLVNNIWLSVNPVLLGCLTVGLVFILPLTDTITVSVNRLLKGNSPFIGGKDHTTHHLFFKGFTEKRIALLYFAIGLIGLSLALNQILNYNITGSIAAVIFCAVTFVSLYINTVLKRK